MPDPVDREVADAGKILLVNPAFSHGFPCEVGSATLPASQPPSMSFQLSVSTSNISNATHQLAQTGTNR